MRRRCVVSGLIIHCAAAGLGVALPRAGGAGGGPPGAYLNVDVPVVEAGGLELRWWEVTFRADRKLNAGQPLWTPPRAEAPQSAMEADKAGWWLMYVKGQVREPHATIPFWTEPRAEVRVMKDEAGRDLLASAVEVPLASMRMPGETRYPLPLRPQGKGKGVARATDGVEIAYRLAALPRRFSEVSGVVHATQIVAWSTVDVPIREMKRFDEQVKGVRVRIKSVRQHDVDAGARELRMRYEYTLKATRKGGEEGVPFVASLELLDAQEKPLKAVDVRSESDAKPVVEADGTVVLRDGYVDWHERGGGGAAAKPAMVRVYVVTAVKRVEIPFVLRDLGGAGGAE